ncbi:hypothetical protein J437_LFUL016444 [Ladona fulva]|uniref:Testis-expressed sequence 264 protein n=1 Tax=Ladona fulva TaxID=123851 RepID=A0A8K0PCA8_LADFU|nr:hypothetical protein J437_LFUL016444 [Ladona fulva]
MIFLVLILLFLVIAAYLFCSYYGILTEVCIKTNRSPFGRLAIAYKFSRGPYSKASQLFVEANCVMPNHPRIGIFYGDRHDPASPLSFAIGSILNDRGELPDEKTIMHLRSYGYKFFIFPEVSFAVTGSFPYKNSLSLFFAVLKIYPKIGAYVAARNLCAHPVIEIYGPSNILFVAPLARQSEFYVPEAEDLHDSENSFPLLNGKAISCKSPLLPLGW